MEIINIVPLTRISSMEINIVQVRKILSLFQVMNIYVCETLRIERPISTNDNDAKFFMSIKFIPFNLQTTSYFSFVDDNNFNVNSNIMITNQYYAIRMCDEYQVLFNHIITNNIGVPLVIINQLDTHCEADLVPFCNDANRILNEENAGGNSALSEAFSYEVISQMMNNITLYKTEMEVSYWWNAWKKTDYIFHVKDSNNETIKCSVSVTRAMKYLTNIKYTFQDALHLLKKKLNTVNESFKGVLLEDEWQRQILHVFCQTPYVANIIYLAFRHLQLIDPVLCSNTILFITITNENCNSIYFTPKKNTVPKR